MKRRLVAASLAASLLPWAVPAAFALQRPTGAPSASMLSACARQKIRRLAITHQRPRSGHRFARATSLLPHFLRKAKQAEKGRLAKQKNEAVVPAVKQPAFKLSDTPSSHLAWGIAENARAVAERTGTMGRCFAAVKNALQPFGVLLAGAAAWMAAPQLAKDKRFVVQPPTDVRPGDIMVHGKSRKHPFGHIAVYLGNKAEASDHVQPVVTGGAYGRTIVFRIKEAAAPEHAVPSEQPVPEQAAPEQAVPEQAVPESKS